MEKETAKKNCQTLSGKFDFRGIYKYLLLSWSHYVKMLVVKIDEARKILWKPEALRRDWTVRKLERQIN